MRDDSDDTGIEPSTGTAYLGPYIKVEAVIPLLRFKRAELEVGPNLIRTTSTSIAVTQPSGPSFRDVGGQMIVDFGQSLFDRWRQGGLAGTNVRHAGGTQVEILDPANARIDNIVLHPGERFTLDVHFSARVASAETYLVKVALWGPAAPNENPIDLGGVLYEITVSDQERSK